MLKPGQFCSFFEAISPCSGFWSMSPSRALQPLASMPSSKISWTNPLQRASPVGCLLPSDTWKLRNGSMEVLRCPPFHRSWGILLHWQLLHSLELVQHPPKPLSGALVELLLLEGVQLRGQRPARPWVRGRCWLHAAVGLFERPLSALGARVGTRLCLPSQV